MTNCGTRTICFGEIDYPRVICHLMPLGNDNKEVNSTAQMDKKVRIIFFFLLSLCVWIVLQFGLAIYNLFSNLI